MRVTHVVCSDRFAGVERYLTNTLPALAARGIEVHLVGGPERAMRDALAGSGAVWHPGATMPAAVRSLWPLRRSLVHAHMTAAEAVALSATAISGAPVVTTRHFARRRGSSTPARAAGRLAARRLAREIAVSRFVADHIDVDSVVLHNGVPGMALGPHADRTVLVAQRLEAEKETSIALRAWAQSGLGDRGWRMVVAGSGSREAELRRLRADLGVDGTVELAGFDKDVHATMARAGILLATAPAEPFGLAVVEAMACGLPVVAAAAGGHLETVGAAVPESLFPSGDAGAAAQRLVRLAEDPDLRRAQGQRLRDHQRAHLSIETHVDGLLAVYEEILQH